MTVEKGFRLAQQIIKILLYCSIGLMICSCSVSIMMGVVSAFFFNFLAVYFSVYVLSFAIIGLTTIAFYRIYIHDKIWANIRREVLLLFISMFSLSLFAMITNLEF